MHFNTEDLPLQQLHQDLLYAESVRNALDEKLRHELESSEFLSENAQEFSELICRLLEVLDLYLRVTYYPQLDELANRAVDDSQDQSGDAVRLEFRIFAATQVAAKLTSLLKFVYGSSAKNNPRGIVAQIDRLCRSLFAEARPIIRPGWEYNYTFGALSQALQRIAVRTARWDSGLWRGLSNVLDEEHYFFSLTYSPTAVDNVLNMGIWAHEIGHFVDKISVQCPPVGEFVDRRYASRDQFYSSVLFRDFEIMLPEQLKEMLAARLNARAGDEPVSEDDLERVANEISEPIAQAIQRWAKELFADLFSIRLFGPAALFGFVRFAHPLSPEFIVSPNSTHPPLRIRLKVMMDAYESWNDVNPAWVDGLPPEVSDAYRKEIAYLNWLASVEFSPVESFNGQGVDKETFNHLLAELIYGFVERRLSEAVNKIAMKNEDCCLSANDMHLMGFAIKDLENSLPLDFSGNHPRKKDLTEVNKAKIMALTINAGWLYWISKANQWNQHERVANWGQVKDDRLQELNNINLLLSKSIENAEARFWFEDRRRFGREEERRPPRNLAEVQSKVADWLPANAGGALTGDEIFSRIYGSVPSERKLEVRPLLDRDSQVGTCSLDIRLGNEFIITKLPVLTRVDPTEPEEGSSTLQFQSKLHLPLGKPFVLHPGQFVLGSTLEYLALSEDIMGFLVGRSSWGRLGLVIASTSKIIPGFKGCITLELTNLGNAPILLYPCARIAQVMFFKMQGWPEVDAKWQSS